MDDFHKNEPAAGDIERRAYGFYLLRGMAEGKDVEDWIRAEEELREEFVGLNRERNLVAVNHDRTSIQETQVDKPATGPTPDPSAPPRR